MLATKVGLYMSIFGVSVLLASPQSIAAQCDFAKPVGSCKGQITIDSSKGSKGSYSAEVTVRSSAPTCSKVEYFIDNTPHQTILKSSSSDSESLFGTTPVTRNSIKLKKCTAYEDRETTAKDQTSKSGETGLADAKFFEGSWYGQVGILFLKAGLTLTMDIKGSTVTGTGHSHNDTGDYEIRNGRFSGGRVTFEYTEPMGTATDTVTVTRKSANSISYVGTGSGITFTGVLTKQ